MITKDFTAIHPAYTCEQSLYIDEMKGWAGLLRHKKTGARVVLVSNDDTNKVFTIGFRTPPKDRYRCGSYYRAYSALRF